MAQGGKRAGAGRKKGFAAVKAEQARAYVAEQVGASLGSIVESLIKKAVTGDIRASQVLFERAYGRPFTPEGEPPSELTVTITKYAHPRDLTDQQLERIIENADKEKEEKIINP